MKTETYVKTVECDKAKLDGKLVQANYTAKDFEYEHEIKKQLTNMISEFIMQNNLCEFTYIEDPIKFQNTYRCRAFLLAKDCVRELRETGQI